VSTAQIGADTPEQTTGFAVVSMLADELHDQ
jgi:hypothetical protein